MKPLSDRFWEKVNVGSPEECWDWLACKQSDGYGQIKNRGKVVLAHRMSYELNCGAIPEGFVVCHSCDNHSCVNPNHLFIGTDFDNMEDMVSKGRQARGEGHGRSKLTEQDVLEIRWYCERGVAQRAVAQLYDVQPAVISKIHRRALWAYL